MIARRLQALEAQNRKKMATEVQKPADPCVPVTFAKLHE